MMFPSRLILLLLAICVIIPGCFSVFFVGDDGQYGGTPGVLVTFSTAALYDAIFLGLGPYFVSYMDSLQIPDFEQKITFGIGEADVKLSDFTITSFAFFPDDDVLISAEPGIDGVYVKASGASIAVNVGYSIKLLTYPFTSFSGQASLSVGSLGLLTII
eukprot:gnl/Carplike_NY0171/5645_a7734_336.p1 GENE.gnl/Carplike_NY0171/5645_a7734_336~~gnl/Carplike_NY0171/5645_a7734_336.p1  ORF type:complete len:159 (-),score=20.65 gnl/Carplike_NY0171/5645_a7734_336:65-541(-)